MLATVPFDPPAAERRRASEPTWRRFPSLWETFPAKKAGFLDSLAQFNTGQSKAVSVAIGSAALDKFFSERKPQALYPYVWVRNALNPVPDAHGMHQWLHEVLVSYEANDMPETAPIRFANGELLEVNMRDLQFGVTSRYGRGNLDLVPKHCAYVHVGPAQRRAGESEIDAYSTPTPTSTPTLTSTPSPWPALPPEWRPL